MALTCTDICKFILAVILPPLGKLKKFNYSHTLTNMEYMEVMLTSKIEKTYLGKCVDSLLVKKRQVLK